MAAAAPERNDNLYQDGGGFGKFQKRRFRRTTHMTPYDRPPTAIRTPSLGSGNISNNNGWLSKLVDPAQKFITSSAHRLFASVFRKRLPPPATTQPAEPAEANLGPTGRQQQEPVSTVSVPAAVQREALDRCDNANNSTDKCGVTELELILKQKEFTRSEIDRLTALLQSKVVDLPIGDEGKSGVIPSKAVLPQGKKNFPETPVKVDGIQSSLVSTPNISFRVLDEDVASPADLAKSYMGSRASKVSPAVLGIRQPWRENSLPLINHPFPSKLGIMSIAPRSSGPSENAFLMPRSRGRSAIYSMARTPYSRAQASTLQDAGTGMVAFGGPSSSSKSPLVTNSSGAAQGALKRRNSLLENDIGSAGPIRRIRQRSNLLPNSGTLSIGGTGLATDVTQHTSSTPKPVLAGKQSMENGYDSVHGSGFTPVSSKSSEMASKILHQLGTLVSSKQESHIKLSPSMLSGPAPRSLENVDSSKFLENIQDDNKPDAKRDTSYLDARDSLPQKHDMAEENGPMKSLASTRNDADTKSFVKNNVSDVKTTPSLLNSVAQSSGQKKKAFQINAHENYLELSDNDYSNGLACGTMNGGREKLDGTLAGHKHSAIVSSTLEKLPASSEIKPILNQKSIGSSFGSVKFQDTSAQQALVDGQYTVSSDKATSSKESDAVSPIFGFGEKSVSLKETNGAWPISDFMSKTADRVPQFASSSSSSVVIESSGLKIGASESKQDSSSSHASVAAANATESQKKEPRFDNAEHKNSLKSGVSFSSPETVSSAVSTSSFGIPTSNSSLNNGSISTPFSFSSPSTQLVSNNITGQNSSGSSINAVDNRSNVATAIADTTANTTSGSLFSGSASVSSFSGAPFIKFAPPAAPSTSASSVLALATTAVESAEAKTRETSFANLTSGLFSGTSSAITSTGSNVFNGMSAPITNAGSSIFGGTSATMSSAGSIACGTSHVASTRSSVFNFNSGATAPAASNLLQGSNPFSASSALTTESSLATSSQSTPNQLGSSSASSPFGLTGNTVFSSNSSLFSPPASTSNLFSSGSSFGPASSTSIGANTSSSTTASATVFGSSWQAPTSSIFGSAFNSSPSPAGFAFGVPLSSNSASSSTSLPFGSSTNVSSGLSFSFNSAAATHSQPVIGNPNPNTTFGSSAAGNDDQMNMEDSMAEDTVQATTPSVPVFSQQPITPPTSGFVFGSTTPVENQFGSTASSGANPFQFGSQPNVVGPQNPSPFQASGSLEFKAGGSFSLGADDKSNRKFLKVKRTPRRK